MDWIANNKDVLALLVSLVALALSVWSTRQTVAESGVLQERELRSLESASATATFQRLHEQLIQPQAAGGRRLLFECYQKGVYPELGMKGWDEINYALALYDTLGGYLARGEVPMDATLEAWQHPLRSISAPVRAFMEFRSVKGISQPWAHLWTLIEAGEAFECRCHRSGGFVGTSV